MNQATTNYFFPYGIPSFIIGLSVAVIYAVADKLIKEKKGVIKGYLPFITGIALNFLYGIIIFGLKETFNLDTVYYGIISGSMGTVIFTLFKKIKSGKISKDELRLIIEEILLGILRPEQALTVSLEIKKLLEEDFSEVELLSKIEQTVKDFSSQEISKEDLTSLVELIKKAKKTIK